jgi:hypothetical protein
MMMWLQIASPGESIEESGKSLAGRVFGVDRSSNRINPILFNSESQAASAITIDSSAFLPISLKLQLTDGAHHLLELPASSSCNTPHPIPCPPFRYPSTQKKKGKHMRTHPH